MAKKKRAASSTTTAPPEMQRKRRRYVDAGTTTTASPVEAASATPQYRTAGKKKAAKKAAPKKRSGGKRSTNVATGVPIDARSVLLGSIREQNKDQPAKLCLIDESFGFKVGLQIPLPLQFVIGYGVLPLGVVMEVNGPPMSMKTAFAYEMGRMFIDRMGMEIFLVTEGKISEAFAQSIIGYNQAAVNGFAGYITESMNEWQKLLMDHIKLFTNAFTKGNAALDLPKGQTFPVLMGVDSIMGANLLEVTQKIDKDGFAGRQHPVAALSLTNYLKDAANKIAGHPINLLFINHRKESEPDPQNPYAPVRATKAGGKHVRFQASYELVLHKVGHRIRRDTHPDGAADVHYRTIKIECLKNSGGTDGNGIEVDVSWRWRRIGGRLRQVTIWHWDAVIPQMIVSWHEGKLYAFGRRLTSTGGRLEQFDRFFHLRAVNGGSRGKLYFSKTLGMEKSDAVNAGQMGRMIMENPEAVASIQQAFGIEPGIVWKPGVNYYDLFDKASNASEKQLQSYLRTEADNVSFDEILRDDDEIRPFTASGLQSVVAGSATDLIDDDEVDD